IRHRARLDRRRRGVAETGQVQGHHTGRASEALDLGTPHPMVERKAVNQDERRPARSAAVERNEAHGRTLAGHGIRKSLILTSRYPHLWVSLTVPSGNGKICGGRWLS